MCLVLRWLYDIDFFSIEKLILKHKQNIELWYNMKMHAFTPSTRNKFNLFAELIKYIEN